MSVVIGQTIVRRWAVSLYFFSFPFLGDDHIAGVTPNVDDVVEIAIGVVV